MRKTFERGALLGLGALSLTREKAQAVADELEQRGLIDRKHARGFVTKLVGRGQAERAALRDLVQKEIATTVQRAGLASAREVATLNKRVAGLERERKKGRGKAKRTTAA